MKVGKDTLLDIDRKANALKRYEKPLKVVKYVDTLEDKGARVEMCNY